MSVTTNGVGKYLSILLISAYLMQAACKPVEKPEPEPELVKASLELIPEVPEALVRNISDAAVLAGKPRILIVSHYTLDAPYLDTTRMNHKQYAAKHGYDYWFRNGNIDSGKFRNLSNSSKVHNLGLYWQKIFAVKEALNLRDAAGNVRYDVIVWTDSDAFFTSMNTSLEQKLQSAGAGEILQKNSNMFFVIAEDQHDMVNSGVFFVKNDEQGNHMIDTVEQLFNFYKDLPWPEQTAIGDIIYGYAKFQGDKIEITPYKENPVLERKRDPAFIIKGAKLLPQREINSFYLDISQPEFNKHGWHAGDFICHFAGLPAEYRRTQSVRLLACVDAHAGKPYGCERGAGWEP